MHPMKLFPMGPKYGRRVTMNKEVSLYEIEVKM